ncbi:MAG: DUF1580 domain-containing protein [Planctomycetes bacterium]|nr:DUF1580 domain-containing protein [Planctomycetota bacterium]
MKTQLLPSHPTAPHAQTIADRLLDEGALPIVEAARREGITISGKTALRWALHGTAGARLESVRIGGRRMTSGAAIRRFVEAQQKNPLPVAQALDLRATDAVLAAHGITRGGDQ